MIDSRIGNPKFQIEILQDFFSRYGVKDFMKSEVPLEYLEIIIKMFLIIRYLKTSQ